MVLSNIDTYVDIELKVKSAWNALDNSLHLTNTNYDINNKPTVGKQ